MGAWSADDVGEGGVFDGLVFGGEASVVLALVFAPGGHWELFQEQVWAAQLPDDVPEAALGEVDQLEPTSDQRPESSDIETWLDTILNLLGSTKTTDWIDIQGSREVEATLRRLIEPAAADLAEGDTAEVGPAAADLEKDVSAEEVGPAAADLEEGDTAEVGRLPILRRATQLLPAHSMTT